MRLVLVGKEAVCYNGKTHFLLRREVSVPKLNLLLREASLILLGPDTTFIRKEVSLLLAPNTSFIRNWKCPCILVEEQE